MPTRYQGAAPPSTCIPCAGAPGVSFDDQRRAVRRTSQSASFWALVFPVATGFVQDAPWPGRELRDGHMGQVEGIAFSSDGSLLASADNGGTVVVHSVPAMAIVARLRGKNFTEVAWSADGGSLVAGGFDSLIYVWRWPPDEPPRTLPYPGPVETVTLAPNGVLFAAGAGDRTIRRWQLSTGEELPPLHGHTDDVYAVRVSPNGRWIVSGGRDRTIRIWDAHRGRGVRVLRDHDDSVYDLAFTRDGALLVSGCRDGTIGIWNTQGWRLQRLLRGPENSVHAVAVSPDNHWLAGASFDNRVWIWPLTGAGGPLPLAGHRRKVSGVAFSPDGRLLASAASDTTIRLWSVP